ncbi:hypothetical protein DRO30_02830 [Candidatus Bathyarchaeota archaeon]|nr:MAG: hypothetical protein DRO30_02830 [Candidatus Bathyarchaeota archaeon]
MKVLLLKGGLRLLVRVKVKVKGRKLRRSTKLKTLLTLRENLALKPIKGYSMTKIMVSGLILPLITTIFLLFSITLSLALNLPPLTRFLFMCLWTFSGFILATIILIHFTDKILSWAREKK